MPRILISTCCFIFCLSEPTKHQNISRHSRLRNSLKNHIINKFEILIRSIDPKLSFFVKSLHIAGMGKRDHDLNILLTLPSPLNISIKMQINEGPSYSNRYSDR